MSKRPINYLKTSLIICSLIFPFVSCGNRPNRNPQVKVGTAIIKELKIDKAIFYLENSESMFGYVNGITNYVDVVSELVEKPDFILNNTLREFYFINGIRPSIIPLGNNPDILIGKLNNTGFNCGDITNSNLNAMFKIALQNANENNISILISDGIYDVGDNGLASLATLGTATRSEFIRRLQLGDLQTIMIKLNSEFIGDYFYTSKTGKVHINSNRPYYVWIFGDNKLLNKYFSNKYFSEKLKGYETIARFMNNRSLAVQFQVTTDKLKGTFSFDHKENNCLVNAKSDRLGKDFQFSVAVDYSSLPFPESYLTNISNYHLTNGFNVIGIEKPQKNIYNANFLPTHLITVHTNKSPLGKLVISLKNITPSWIAETESSSETNIQTDRSHTYGFKYLTNGITEAYEYMSDSQDIVNFKIEIR